MIGLLAALGWAAALCALAMVAILRASSERRLALVAEAAHECARRSAPRCSGCTAS